MSITENQVEVVRQAVIDFAYQFIKSPYLCYTEHGLHALFYSQLFNNIPPEKRFVQWQGEKVCVVQKEYPTFGNLGKPKRQHWDVAVIKDPAECRPGVLHHLYDYLSLVAVVEFGLNVGESHLIDDIERLTHADSNVENRFIVNLYRLSRSGHLFSGRDLSSVSAQVMSMQRVAQLINGKEIEIVQGIYDSSGRYPCSLYHFRDTVVTSLV